HARGLERGVRNQHVCQQLFRRCLKPARNADGLAQGCDRVAALSIADARDNSRAAVNANSDPQGYRQCRAKLRIERACSSEHIPTGGDGIATAHAALSVEPENGHCAVAQVHADPTAVRLSRLSDLLKE